MASPHVHASEVDLQRVVAHMLERRRHLAQHGDTFRAVNDIIRANAYCIISAHDFIYRLCIFRLGTPTFSGRRRGKRYALFGILDAWRDARTVYEEWRVPSCLLVL